MHRRKLATQPEKASKALKPIRPCRARPTAFRGDKMSMCFSPKVSRGALTIFEIALAADLCKVDTQASAIWMRQSIPVFRQVGAAKERFARAARLQHHRECMAHLCQRMHHTMAKGQCCSVWRNEIGNLDRRHARG